MMKTAALFLHIGLAYTLFACNSTPEKDGSEVEQPFIEDSLASAVPIEQDTTLQPKVELVLRATGNTPEEIAFDQDTLQVNANDLVMLSLINEGTELTMIHNFVLTGNDKYKQTALAGARTGATGNYIPDTKDVIVGTPLALPGQTVTHEFKAPPPGTYDFVCTYPDHWQRMHGKLIVK